MIPMMRTKTSRRSQLRRSARQWLCGISNKSNASMRRCGSGCLGVLQRRVPAPHRQLVILHPGRVIIAIEEGGVKAVVVVVVETIMTGGISRNGFMTQTPLHREGTWHIYRGRISKEQMTTLTMKVSKNHDIPFATLDRRMLVGDPALAEYEWAKRYAQDINKKKKKKKKTTTFCPDVFWYKDPWFCSHMKMIIGQGMHDLHYFWNLQSKERRNAEYEQTWRLVTKDSDILILRKLCSCIDSICELGRVWSIL